MKQSLYSAGSGFLLLVAGSWAVWLCVNAATGIHDTVLFPEKNSQINFKHCLPSQTTVLSYYAVHYYDNNQAHETSSVTMNMETACSSERLEQTYYPMQYNDSEDYRLNTRCESP